MKWVAVLLFVALAIDGLPALNLGHSQGTASEIDNKKTRELSLREGVFKEDSGTFSKTASQDEQSREQNQLSSLARSENQVGSSSTQSDSERRRSEETERNRQSQSLSSGGLNNLLQSQQTSRRRGDESRNIQEYNRDHFSSYDRNGGNTRSVDSVDESGNQSHSKRSYDEDSNRNYGLGNEGLTDSRSGSRSTSQSETDNAFKRNLRAQEETAQQDGSTVYRRSLSGSNEENKQFQQSSSQSAYYNQEQSNRDSGSPGLLNSGRNPDTSGQYNINNLLRSPSSPADFNRGPVHPMRHSPFSYIPTQVNGDTLYNQNHNYGTDNGNYGSHPGTYGGRYTPNLGNQDGRHGIWNHAQNNDQLLRREREPYRNNNFGTGFQGANPADYINQNHRINNPMQYSGYEYQPSGINEFPRRVPNQVQNQGREDFSDNLRQGPNHPRFNNGIGNQGIDSGKYLNGLPLRNGPSSNSNEYLNGLLNHARAAVNYPGTANPGINVNRGLFQGGPSNANQYPIETEDANTKYISDILSKAQYLLKHGTLPNGNGVIPAHHHPTPIIEPVYEVPNQGIRFFEAPVGSYIANPSSATNDDGFREVVPDYVVPAIIVPEQNAYPNAPFYTPNYGGFGPVVEYLPGTDGKSPTTIFGRSLAYSVAPVLPINTIPVNNDRTGLLVDRALAYAPLPPLAPVVPLTPLTPVQPFDNAFEGPRGDASDASAIITDATVLPVNTIPVNNDGLLVDRTLTYAPLTPLAPMVPSTPLTPETPSNDSEGTSGDASAIITNRKVVQEYDTTYGPTTFNKGLRFTNTHGIRYPDIDNADTSRDVDDGLLDKSVKKHTNKNSRNSEKIENKEDDITTIEDGETIVIVNNNVIENNGGKKDQTVERIKKGLDLKDRSINKEDEPIKNSTEDVTEKNTYKSGKDKGIKDKTVVRIKKDSEKDNGSDNKDNEKTTEKNKPIETNNAKVRNIDKDDKNQNIKDKTDKDGKYKGITDKAIEITKTNLEKGDDSNNKHTGKTKSNQPKAIKKNTAPENTDKSIKTILIDKTTKNTYRDANNNGKKETTITEINNNVTDKTTLSKQSENEKEKTVKISGNNDKSSPIDSKYDKNIEKIKPIGVNNTAINNSNKGSGINNKTVDKNKTVLNKDDWPGVVDKKVEKNIKPVTQIVTGNKKELEKDDKGNDNNKKPAKSIVDKANQIKDAGRPNTTDKNDKTTIKNKTAENRSKNVAGSEEDDQCNDEDCDNDNNNSDNKNYDDGNSYEDEVGDDNDEITETDKDKKSEDGKYTLVNKKPVLDNKPKNGGDDKKNITKIEKVSRTDNINVTDQTTVSKKSESEKEKTEKVTKKISGNNDKSIPIDSKDDKTTEKSKPIVGNNTAINNSDKGRGINNKTVDKNKTVLNKDDRPDVVDKNDEKNTKPVTQIVTGNKKELEIDDKGNDSNKKPAKSIVDKAKQIKDAGRQNATDKKIDDTIKNDKTATKNKTVEDRPKNVAGSEDDDQCNDEDCDNDNNNSDNKNYDDDDIYEEEVYDENDEITKTNKDKKSKDGKYTLINKKPVKNNKPRNGGNDEKTTNEIEKVSGTDNKNVTDKTTVSKKSENAKEKTVMVTEKISGSNDKSSPIDSKDEKTTEKSKPIVVNNTAINNSDKGNNNKTVDKNKTVLKTDDRSDVIDKNDTNNTKSVKDNVTKPGEENDTKPGKEDNTKSDTELGNYIPSSFDDRDENNVGKLTKKQLVPDKNKRDASSKEVKSDATTGKLQSNNIEIGTKYNEKDNSVKTLENVASSEEYDQCNDENCDNDNKNDDDDDSYEDEIDDKNDEVTETVKDKKAENGKYTLINKKPVLNNKPKNGDDKKNITEIKKVSKTDNNNVTDKTTASKKIKNENEKTLKETKKDLESNDKSSPIDSKDHKTTERNKPIVVNNTAINNSEKGSAINNKNVDKNKTVLNKDNRPDVVDKNDKKNTKPVKQIVTENKKELEKDYKGNDKNKKPAKSIVDKVNQIKDAGRQNATNKKNDDAIKSDKTTIKNKTAEDRHKNVVGSEEDNQCYDEDCDNVNNNGDNKNYDDDNSYEDEVDDENDEITETDKNKKSEDEKYTLINKKPVLNKKSKNDDDEKTTTEIKKVSKTDNNNITDKTKASKITKNKKEKALKESKKVLESNDKSSPIDSKDDKTTEKSKPIVVNNTAINNSDKGSGLNNKTIDKNKTVLNKDNRPDVVDKNDKKNTKPVKQIVTENKKELEKDYKGNDKNKKPAKSIVDKVNQIKDAGRQNATNKKNDDAIKSDKTTIKNKTAKDRHKNVVGSEEDNQCYDKDCDNVNNNGDNKNYDDDNSYEDEVDDENDEITETDKNKKSEDEKYTLIIKKPVLNKKSKNDDDEKTTTEIKKVSKTDNNNITDKTKASKITKNEKEKALKESKKVLESNDKSSPIDSKDDKTTEKSKPIVVNNTAINNSDKGSGLNNKTVDKNKTVLNKDDRPDFVVKNDEKNTKPAKQIVTGNITGIKKRLEKDYKGNEKNEKPGKSIVDKANQIKDAGRPNTTDKKIDKTIKNDKTTIKNKTAEDRPKNVAGSDEDDQCSDEDCDKDGYNKNNNDDDSYEDEVEDENYEITETDKDRKSKDGNYNLINKKPVLDNKPKNGDDDEKTITKIEKVSRTDNNNVTDKTTVSKKSENEKGKIVKVIKNVSGNYDKSSPIDSKDEKTTEKSKPIIVNNTAINNSDNGSGINNKIVDKNKTVLNKDDRPEVVDKNDEKNTKPVKQIVTGNITGIKKKLEKEDKGNDKKKKPAKSIVDKANQIKDAGRPNFTDEKIDDTIKSDKTTIKNKTAEYRPKDVAGSEENYQCIDEDCDYSYEDEVDDENDEITETDKDKKSKDGNYNLINKKPVLDNKPKNGDDDEKTITKIEKVSRSDNNNVTDQTTVSKKTKNEKGKTVKVTKNVSGNNDKSMPIDSKDDKTTEKSKPIVVNDNNNVTDKTNVSKKSENGKGKTVKETKKVFESNNRSNPIESKNNKTTKNVTIFQPVPDKNKWDAISKEVNSNATTGEPQYKNIEIGTEYNEKDEFVKTPKNVADSEDDQCNDEDCDNDDDDDDYDDADDDNEAFGKTNNSRKPESNGEKNNEIVTNIQKEIVKGKRGQQNNQDTDTADSESDENFNKNELMKNNYGKKGESVSVDNTYGEEYDDDDDENDAINSSDEVKKSVNNGSTKYETIKKFKKDFELKIPNNDHGTGSVDAVNDKIAEDGKSTLTNNKPVSDSQPKNGDDDKDDLSGKTEKGKKSKTYNGDKHKIVPEVIKGKQDQQNDQESESDEDFNKNELTKNSDDKKDGSSSDDDTYIEKYDDDDDTDNDDENDTIDRSDQLKKLGSNSETKYETIKEFEKDLDLTRLKNNHRRGSANTKNDAILKDENSSVFDDENEGDEDWWYYNDKDRKTKISESNSGKDKKVIGSEIDQKRKKDGSEVILDDISNEDSQSSSLELSSSFEDDESKKPVNSDKGDQNENDDGISRTDNGNKSTRNRDNKHNISTKIGTLVGQKDQKKKPETESAVSDKTFGKLDGSDNDDDDFSIENYDDDDDDEVDLFDKSSKSSKYGNRKDKKVRGSENSNESGIEDRDENVDDRGGQSGRNDDKERQIVKKEPTIIVLEKDSQNENDEDQDWWLYNNEDEKIKKPERNVGEDKKDKKAIKSENGEGFSQKDSNDKVNGTDKSGIDKPARNDNDARKDNFSSESSDENYDDKDDDYDYEYDVSDKSGETDQSGRNYGNKKKQVEGCGTDDSCSNVNLKNDSDRTSKLPARKGDEKNKIVTKIGTTVVEKKDNRSNSANGSDKNGNSDAKNSDSTIKTEPRNDESNGTGNKDKNLVKTKNGKVSSDENCDDENKTKQPGRIGGQKHNTGQKGQKNGNCKDSKKSENNEIFIDGTSTGDRKIKDDKRDEIDKIWRAKNYTDSEKHLTKSKQDVESSNGNGSDLKHDGKNLKNSKSKDLHKKVITKIDAHKIRTKISKPTQQKNDDKNESNNKTIVHESIGHKNEDEYSAKDIKTSEGGESAVAGKQSKNKKHNQGDVVSNDTKDEPSNGSTRKHVVSKDKDASTTDTTSTTDSNASKPKTLAEKDSTPDSKNNLSEDNRYDKKTKSKNDSKSKTDKSTEEKKDTTSGSQDDGTDSRQSAATYYTNAGIKTKTENGYKTINPKKRIKTTINCAPRKATGTDAGQEKTRNNDGDENRNEESSTSNNKEKSESQSYENTKESSTSSTGNKNNDKSNSPSDDSKNSNRSKSRTEEYSESSSGYSSSSEGESITKNGNKIVYKKSSQDKDHSEQKEDSKFTEETTYYNGKTVQSEKSSVSEVSDKISSDNYAEESDGNGNKKYKKDSSSSEDKIVDSNGNTKESKSSSTKKSVHSSQVSSSELKSISN